MKPKANVGEFIIHNRHLPHWELPGATYHIIFTMKDRTTCKLFQDDLAPIILETLEFYANKRYFFYDHTVMPDHVHAILQPIERDGIVKPLGNIVGDIKKYTARKINEALGRKGSLWLDESYDRIIRDAEEYKKITKYIFENPLQAGLIETGEDWKWWRPGIDPQDSR